MYLLFIVDVKFFKKNGLCETEQSKMSIQH